MAIKSDLLAAIDQIAHERKITAESVIESLKAALEAAYKKEYLDNKEAELRVEVNPNTSEIKIFLIKTVVADADFVDADLQVGLRDAKKIQKDLKVDDKIESEIPLEMGFGRIAAQVAKQVILQKIREEEKRSIAEEFKDKEGTIVSGSVQRVARGDVIVELGKATGVMPADEKIFQEYYRTGETYKFLLKKVITTNEEASGHAAQLLLSRSDQDFLAGLFDLEVPEIASGVVEIKATAREAGSRSKVAVTSNQEGVDPIGSCVGQKGMRIMNIQNELSDNNYAEKIDIIEWDKAPDQFVANALSPAKVIDVKLNEADQIATVLVDEDQLSLAIGKEGQNVRLAHKLTGWKIEINPGKETKEAGEKTESSEKAEDASPEVESSDQKDSATEPETKAEKPKKAKKEKEVVEASEEVVEVPEVKEDSEVAQTEK